MALLNHVAMDNLDVSCRTCLVKNHEMQSIFSTHITYLKSYADIIMAIAPIKISETDEFSLQVCSLCIQRMQEAYKFQQQCIQTNSSLLADLNIKLEQSEVENKNSFEDSFFCITDDEFSDNKDSKMSLNESLITDNNEINETKSSTTKRTSRKRSETIKKTDKNFACNICHKVCISKSKLESHMISHTKEKPFVCDTCGRKFPTNGNLKRHKKIHTGEKEHACEVCDKRFCQKDTLIEHRRVHTGEKPFKCSLCTRSFKTNSCLRQHRLGKAHSDVRQDKKPRDTDEGSAFTCAECGRTYGSRNSLYQHSRSHLEKQLCCKICNKEFKSYTGLQLHKRAQHTSEHKFQCSECGKIFKYNIVFKTHMLTHSGVKPYKCQYCEKTFAQRAHVISHERLHTGIKPFQCDICTKSFRHRTTLRDHRRIHTGEVPYKCKICGRGFYHSSTMKKHQHAHK